MIFEGKKISRLNLLNLNFLSTVHSALDFKPLPRFHSSLTRISIVLPCLPYTKRRTDLKLPLPHSSEILCLCLMNCFKIWYTLGNLKTLSSFSYRSTTYHGCIKGNTTIHKIIDQIAILVLKVWQIFKHISLMYFIKYKALYFWWVWPIIPPSLLLCIC